MIVTGGASGLGGAAVDMVVAAGGRAVIVDVNEDAGRQRAAAAHPRRGGTAALRFRTPCGVHGRSRDRVRAEGR